MDQFSYVFDMRGSGCNTGYNLVRTLFLQCTFIRDSSVASQKKESIYKTNLYRIHSSLFKISFNFMFNLKKPYKLKVYVQTLSLCHLFTLPCQRPLTRRSLDLACTRTASGIWLSVGVRPPSFDQVPVAQW